MGKITCPKDYPKHAPNIKLFTENGRFSTQDDGICMSISDMHPESWNPVWKVNQMVVGLTSFWLGDAEDTYGELYEEDYDCEEMSFTDHRIRLAKLSRQQVLDHPKFKSVLSDYAKAIGIEELPREVPGWKEYDERCTKRNAVREVERREAIKEKNKKMLELQR